MNECEYLVALCSFIPFGPQRIKLLRKYFGSAKNTWQASRDVLIEIGLRKKMVDEFCDFRQSFDFKNYFASLKKLSVDFITIDDSNYPKNLLDLDDAPPVIYIRGKLSPTDTNSIAIVGSRKMTTYGREVTEKFAFELASLGITIVSGLAFGVDLTAHKSALEAGGRCIAVLASGIDLITPRSNEWLGLKIIKEGGAVISEFPPNTKVQRTFFPFRNRIISGLSKAVVVIEGMAKSGTLHTASHAANQGRTVFAVPGQITSPMSGAPHFLIKNGAKMVTDVKDILDELDLQLMVNREAVEKILPGSKDEEKLLEVIANEPLHLDEIARRLSMEISDVSSRLVIMELKGLVKNTEGGIYKKA